MAGPDLFGMVALAIGIPLGVIVGRGYAAFTAAMLNFDITRYFVPLWTYAIQILVGLSIPLLAASIPIYKGSRMTVRQAISDYGIDETEFGTNRVDALVVRVRGLSRPLVALTAQYVPPQGAAGIDRRRSGRQRRHLHGRTQRRRILDAHG